MRIIRDNQADGIITSGTLKPGKFGSGLSLDAGEYLSVDGELLSLTQTFTLSLWAKILDDSLGVLARNGQFSIQYDDDNIIRGMQAPVRVGKMPMPDCPAVAGYTMHCLMTDRIFDCISMER